MYCEKVDEGIYRGPRPDNSTDIDHLKLIGIKTLINLQETEDRVEVISAIAEAPFYNFDIEQRAILPPSGKHVDLALKIMKDKKLQPVYVHCQAGVDRTGFVIASYRRSNGFTFEEAIDEMKQKGMHFWFYWWSLFLK